VPTVFREEGFSVHVYDERGAPHKLPHCHIRTGDGEAVLTLPLLTPIHGHVSRAILERLVDRVEEIVDAWERLNG
jgi:hypothetical protein